MLNDYENFDNIAFEDLLFASPFTTNTGNNVQTNSEWQLFSPISLSLSDFDNYQIHSISPKLLREKKYTYSRESKRRWRRTKQQTQDNRRDICRQRRRKSISKKQLAYLPTETVNLVNSNKRVIGIARDIRSYFAGAPRRMSIRMPESRRRNTPLQFTPISSIVNRSKHSVFFGSVFDRQSPAFGIGSSFGRSHTKPLRFRPRKYRDHKDGIEPLAQRHLPLDAEARWTKQFSIAPLIFSCFH